jgi:hypothetical protein
MNVCEYKSIRVNVDRLLSAQIVKENCQGNALAIRQGWGCGFVSARTSTDKENDVPYLENVVWEKIFKATFLHCTNS